MSFRTNRMSGLMRAGGAMDCRYAPDVLWCYGCASKVKTVTHEGEDGHWCDGDVERHEGGGSKIWRRKPPTGDGGYGGSPTNER